MSDTNGTYDPFLLTNQDPVLRSMRFSEILEPDHDLNERLLDQHFRHFRPEEYETPADELTPEESVRNLWENVELAFRGASDLAIGADGDVFVSDQVSDFVQRVNPDGRIAGELGRLRSIAPGAWHEKHLLGHWQARVVDGRIEYENLADRTWTGDAELGGSPRAISTPAGMMLEYPAGAFAIFTRARLDTDPFLLRHAWTIAVWVRAGSAGGPILEHQSDSGETSYAITQNENGGLRAGFRQADGNSVDIVTADGLLIQRDLYHVILSRSGQQLRLFVNGKRVGQREFRWPPPAETEGVLRVAHDGTATYDGAIGDVRIWTRTLGDRELDALPGFVDDRERLESPRGVAVDRAGFIYVLDARRRQILKFDPQHRLQRVIQPRSSMFGLFEGDLVDWSLRKDAALKDGDGKLYDPPRYLDRAYHTNEYGYSQNNANPLTLHSAQWKTDADANGRTRLYFDGQQSYGEARDNHLLQNPPLTLLAWVRPELRDDGDEFPANVISNSGGGVSGFGFGVNVWQSVTQTAGSEHRGSALTIEHPRGTRIVPELAFEADRWYHIAISFFADSFRAYVDGYPVEEFQFPEPSDPSQDDSYGLTAVQLGRHSAGFAHGTRGYFKGYLGTSLKIYGRALGPEEIAYHAGVSLTNPHAIAVDAEGHVLISDTAQDRIYKLDQNGNLMGFWGRRGVLAGEFRYPTAIVVDTSNRIYVVDQDNKRIQIFNSDGHFQGLWENRTDDPNGIQWPIDLCIDGAGNLYVADAEARDVLIFDFNQRFLTRLGLPQVSDSYGSPLLVEVNREGHVYVLTNHSRLHKFRPPLRNRVVIDLRASSWLAAYRRLRMEVDFALRRYERLHAHRENLFRLARDENATIEELDASRGLLRTALERKLRLEGELETFLAQLARDEPGLPGPDDPVDIEEYLSRVAEQNRWQMSLLLSHFEAEARKIDVRRYQISGGEYLDQHGVSLEQHMLWLHRFPDARLDTVLVLPLAEELYSAEPERFLILRNPRFSGRALHPPTCRFEERYRIELTWTGMRAQGLANSINLMPGETRELTITTKRKRSWESVSNTETRTKTSRSLDSATSIQRKDTLENRFEDELNRKYGTVDTQESSRSTSTSTGGSSGGGVSFGPFKFGGKAKSKSTSHTKSSTKTVSSLTNTWRDSLKTLDRVSTELSEENNLSFQNSEESTRTARTTAGEEDLYSEKRRILVRNINEGRTVNYNFFQIQNVYSSLLSAESVEIHFDTGIEILTGTGITVGRSVAADELDRLKRDLRIYPEEGRIEIARILMAQLLRRYVAIPGFEPDDHPRVILLDENERATISLDDRDVQRVYRNVAPVGADLDRPGVIRDLDRCIPLRKRSAAVSAGADASHAVNTGNYYVDSQLGAEPATEEYLEERRVIEADRQRALAEEQRARTAAGVFFPEFPDRARKLQIETEQLIRGPDAP